MGQLIRRANSLRPAIIGFVIRALLSALAFAQVPAFAAGDAQRGRELATHCAACHGADGNSPSPAFPIIAGQHEAYLYTALKAYRDRQRDNAIMAATIVGRSDQDLQDLAAWYASRKGLGEGTGSAAGVVAAQTHSGALIAEGGSDLSAAVSALPDESKCPAETPSAINRDSDNDNLADAYDAAPDDASEFVLDTNQDGRFEICNIQQLQAILTLGEGDGNSTGLAADTRNTRDYELVRSIDAASVANFRPIGNCGPSGNCMNDLDKFGFKGSFDGRGHTISNLTINAPDVGGVGLFGVISKGKVVRNIELRNANTNGRAGTGTVVGSNFGTVYNCHATGKVKGMFAIGGLVGANAGNISYSHADVDVSGQMAVGGLVGDQNSTVFASYATGMVNGGRGTGGLIGLNTRGRVVSSYATGDVSGGKDIGGLVGLNTDALLANSFATGNVRGTEINAGGLVGFNSMSRIYNSYATGDVSGASGAGGITGNNNGSVLQSFALGKVSGLADVGGLVGKNADGRLALSFWDLERSGQTAPSGTLEGDFSGARPLDDARLRGLDAAASGWMSSANADATLKYCDSDGSGDISANEQRGDNRIWDFGSASELPAIVCTPGAAEKQRG